MNIKNRASRLKEKNFFEKGQRAFFQTYRDFFRDERCTEVLLGDARARSIAAIDSEDRSKRGQRQAGVAETPRGRGCARRNGGDEAG